MYWKQVLVIVSVCLGIVLVVRAQDYLPKAQIHATTPPSHAVNKNNGGIDSTGLPEYPGLVRERTNVQKAMVGDGGIDPVWGTPTTLSPINIHQLNTFINKDADPCSDFYEYACGSWISKIKNSHQESYYSYAFSEIAEKVQEQIVDAMYAHYGGDNKPFRFFMACNDTEAIDKRGWEEPIKPLFDMVDTITDLKSFLHVLGTLQRQGHAPGALATLGLMPDIHLGYENRLTILPKGLSSDYIWKDFDTFVPPVVEQAFKLCGFDDPHTSALNVGKVEEQLKSGMPNWAFGKGFVEILGSAVEVSQEDLARLTGVPIKSYIDALTGFPIQDLKITTWREGASWPKLATNFEVYSYRDYLKWHILFGALDYLPEEFRRLADVVEDTFGERSPTLSPYAGVVMNGNQRSRYPHLQTKRQNMRDLAHSIIFSPNATESDREYAQQLLRSAAEGMSHEDVCKKAVMEGLTEIIERWWVEASVPAQNKETATKMVESIMSVMKTHLSSLDWLDEPTKNAALDKLRNMAVAVGYNTPWDTMDMLLLTDDAFGSHAAINSFYMYECTSKAESNVTRSRFNPMFEQPIFDQNAFYFGLTNGIYMLSGLFFEPMFSSNQHMLLNFASYGMVIGHEIVHGFDDDGRKFGPLGQLQDWWDAESNAQFESRSKCYINQYNDFHFPFPNSNVDGEQTLGENIADNGGVSLAYDAYKAALGDIDPLFPGMTNDQLFFTWQAQSWCTYATDDIWEELLESDVHSPAPFRIKGSLSNLPAFAKAFNCKAADYPQHYYSKSLTDSKCQMY